MQVINVLIAASAEKAFNRDDGKQFDVVFNLAGETKYGQNEAVNICLIFGLPRESYIFIYNSW